MKRRFLLQSTLVFFLLLCVVVYAGRILRFSGGWKLDLGGGAITTLSPETTAFLERLDGNLVITFFVSSREKMPSHLKEVEEAVRSLLTALKERAPERVDYRVIDPERSGAPGIVYAARKKASSFSVRRVLQDEHGEQNIWSSLILAYGDHPEVLIQGIENSHLPHLEELVVQHLKALERPPRPTFAVAAPPSFQLLSAFLGEYGHVLQFDLDRQPSIPLEAGVLFWMQPSVVTPEHVRQLRRFVDSGRTAILAGSAYAIGYLPEEGETRYAARLMPPAWSGLLQPFGLRPLADLLMDRNSGPVFIGDSDGSVREVEASFHLRCLPAFYNIKSFLGPGRGGLSFVAASSLEIDPRRVAKAGFQAEIVGTTTENAWVSTLPLQPFGDADIEPELLVPKQNLMVLLKSADPWKGQIFVLASASPFQDGIINQSGYAHQIFLRTLVRTFTEPGRLARIRVERLAPQSLPPLGTGARFFWRFFTVFLIPAVLIAMGARRYFRGGGTWPALGPVVWIVIRVGGALIVIALAAQLWQLSGRLYFDLTEESINTPSPLTQQTLAGQRDGLEAEFFITPKASMPPSLKGVESRVQSLLVDGGVELRKIRPHQLSLQDRHALHDRGISPFPAQRVLDDTLTDQQIWSGLRFRQDGRSVVVPRLDVRSVGHLEFLVTAALERLSRGYAPHVAVISDLPRLSPAEAMEDYHRKGLIPPGGVDVYSQVKSLLADYGYRVSYVNPRDPSLAEDVDLLLWLQPRRDSSRILLLLGEQLFRGGKAIVAMQHFNIQQRQYRGSGFQTVYWPQPQFQDLDRYLRLFGVEQVREVLMDRTRSHLDLETQVNRTAVREYDPQKVALPFLIRAVGAHFSPASAITRHLGDQLFIWGNRFAVDSERLSAASLRHQVLVTTSDQSWSYPWKGGWLSPRIFSPASFLPGRQPLALLLWGRFPPVEFREDEQGRSTLVLRDPVIPGEEGSLLLIGSSEMFKNDYLYASGFEHDQFLLNAVAGLTYGEEMAALQARHRTTRGFSFQSPAVKALWRVAVVCTGPLIFLLYGLRRYRKRCQLLRFS